MPPNRTTLLHYPSLIALLALGGTLVAGHEHHDEDLPPGQVITLDPVDGILWAHIFVMILAFGVLFPTGMVLNAFGFIFNNTGSWFVQIAMARSRPGPGELSCKYTHVMRKLIFQLWDGS